MKKFALYLTLFIALLIPNAYAAENKCVDVSEYEQQIKDKNKDLVYESRIYTRKQTLNFITFTYMEFGTSPPDVNINDIDGLFYLEEKTHEQAIIGVVSDDKICTVAVISKKAFNLIMEALNR